MKDVGEKVHDLSNKQRTELDNSSGNAIFPQFFRFRDPTKNSCSIALPTILA